MPTPIAVRPAGAAELMDCTRQHIYTLVKRGELRLVKSGGASLIPVADIYRHLGIEEPAAK